MALTKISKSRLAMLKPSANVRVAGPYTVPWRATTPGGTGLRVRNGPWPSSAGPAMGPEQMVLRYG